MKWCYSCGTSHRHKRCPACGDDRYLTERQLTELLVARVRTVKVDRRRPPRL